MKWRKLGLVFAPHKNTWWQQHYAMMPTPVFLEDRNIIRVFYGTTDKDRFGRTSYIDLNADNPLQIVHEADTFVLDTGKPGTFDDCGAVPSAAITVGQKQYLYYVGFQRAYKVPYMLFCGLAVLGDNGLFERYSESPIIDRSRSNVYSNAAPYVMFDKDDGLFKMWYWLGKEWVTINGKLYINAEIHYAESADGQAWKPVGDACIVPLEGSEFSVGRPWVLKSDGKYKMYYSVRYVDKLYRLGYAESANGLDWVRKDAEIGLDVSPEGWDAEMVCYPAVINVKGETWLFYNGNNNGETGFGVAALIK